MSLKQLCRLTALVLGACCTRAETPAPPRPFGLVVHGGAGVILRADLPAALEAEYRTALQAALDAGYTVLADGGTALDAVLATVCRLEDSPLYNAGRGAVLNADGVCELDAAIMDGRTITAGAVAGVRHIRNPIVLARDVMEKSPHVLLSGAGAEQFATSLGYTLVPNEYFQTERRKAQLQQARDAEAKGRPAAGMPGGLRRQPAAGALVLDERKFGTVGCVALDRAGNLAAGTSTGGMTNKKFGRVGDSPIIGAGTYANNRTCAVSATGHGEYFIRAVVAYDIAARMEYLHRPLAAAAAETIARVGALGGTGGVIALDARGNIAMPFNTPGMYRGCKLSTGEDRIELFEPGR
jgi:beta-aspartyl-peptidase (threonine type)